MSCFCKQTLSTLTLPNLAVTLPPLPGADLALSLAASLGSLGLPAVAWQPDPDWLSLQLPSLSLSATAMATISALAQLRASVQATLGLDLTVSAQATAFARVAATMSARLAAAASLTEPLENVSVLIKLGTLDAAIEQIKLALSLGLFASATTPALAAFTLPALPQWRVFLSALFSLLPVIAVSIQLGLTIDAQFAANLAASVRALVAIKLPEVDVSAALTLTAALNAVASLTLSLGIDPITEGLPAVQAAIQAKLTALLDVLPTLTLPRLPYCPTLMATSAVVSIAASIEAEALAGLTWQVPPITAIASLRIGLPTVALVKSLAAVSINATLPAPCGSICDANSVLTAALAA